MLPTHAFTGLVLALPVALAMPEVGTAALVAGFLGGVFPDFDMYVGHRKTLHYPVYFSTLAVAVATLALLLPTAATVAAAVFLLAAAVHSVTDVFGGGLELRPWEGTSDRGVYDHYRERWIAPYRWVRYDGAPEDLLLSVTLAVPLLYTLEGSLQWLVVASLAVAVVYTAVRRLLPRIAETLFNRDVVSKLPNPALAYVPTRYREE